VAASDAKGAGSGNPDYFGLIQMAESKFWVR
jgi:hypothetical protein